MRKFLIWVITILTLILVACCGLILIAGNHSTNPSGSTPPATTPSTEPSIPTGWVEQDGKQLVSVPLYRNDEDGGSDGFWDYSSHGALQNPIEKKNQTLVLKTRVTDSLGCTYDLVAGILKLTWDGNEVLQMEHLSAGTEDWPVSVTLPDGNTIELTGIWKY
jgi:hypothetical protein